MNNALCVRILTANDTGGGAARAAMRLALALRGAGCDVMAEAESVKSNLDWVQGPDSFLEKLPSKLRRFLERQIKRLQMPADDFDRSLNLLPTRKANHINQSACDVVNIHWIGNGFVSIEDLARITKPVVWTLHDMWTFCGAEHYASDGVHSRWRTGYRDSPAPGSRGLDLDAFVWRAKHKVWRKPQHVVAPSRWLADCARASALMRGWPVTVIPNPLDTHMFRPMPKHMARDRFGLPKDVPLVAFGAPGSTQDPRKGFDLFLSALVQLAGQLPRAEAVIFGQQQPNAPKDFPLKVHYIGYFTDDTSLAYAYSAADVVVASSRIENLPQAVTEAQSCGCPVVAFNVGGLADAVEQGVTGFLIRPFDTRKLSDAIQQLLSDKDLNAAFGAAARARAVERWNDRTVASQYLDVCRRAIAGSV